MVSPRNRVDQARVLAAQGRRARGIDRLRRMPRRQKENTGSPKTTRCFPEGKSTMNSAQWRSFASSTTHNHGDRGPSSTASRRPIGSCLWSHSLSELCATNTKDYRNLAELTRGKSQFHQNGSNPPYDVCPTDCKLLFLGILGAIESNFSVASDSARQTEQIPVPSPTQWSVIPIVAAGWFHGPRSRRIGPGRPATDSEAHFKVPIRVGTAGLINRLSEAQ